MAPTPHMPQTAQENFVPYDAPPFADAVFHAELAEGTESVQMDLSALELGYVAVSATSEKRMKFQVIQGETTYTYDLASDGTPSFFPLQSGDGSYQFRVMENVEDNRYAEIYAAGQEVTLKDEFQPFLRPSDYVSYGKSSASVKKADELARNAADAMGVVTAVYDFICENVSYDLEKSATVTAGYLPNVDETLKAGKGICFDYAALAAAMLRSQGIPTKMIFGYVSPDDLYHAWNMFYTEEEGWVTVDYHVAPDSWNRLDLTFSANGESHGFIADGDNYTDLYAY